MKEDWKDLERFLRAQEYDYPNALREIQQGKKQSCWMWYVFPQIRGLSRGEYGQYYGIKDLEEAKAYLAHQVLGKRLIEISKAALAAPSDDPYEVFGALDNLKLCSSMTLFELADPEEPVFGQVLEKFFGGKRDEWTLHILNDSTGGTL